MASVVLYAFWVRTGLDGREENSVAIESSDCSVNMGGRTRKGISEGGGEEMN